MPDEEMVPFEYQLFALAFQVEGAISHFAKHLPAEMVGLPQGNQGLYDFYVALLDFYNKTGVDPVEPIAFKSWLQSETELYDCLGGEAIVVTFIATVLEVEKSNADSVAAILKFRYNKRKQLDNVQQLQKLLTKKEHKSDEDKALINSLTDQIRSIENEIGYDPLANVSTAYDLAARADDIWELPDFLPTQFPELNKALGYTENGGFCRGAVHSISAPSGKGKSTFAKCLVNYWADMGIPCLFVNYEEAKAHWDRILMTQVTGKNVYMGATLEERKKYTKIFKDKMLEWGDNFMVRHDPDTPYFDDLEKWLRDIIGHQERIPHVVVIDTIQSMFTKGHQRWMQFEEMMVRLEKLAKDMHAVFIITAQQNTNAMKERRDVVQQSDIAGGITIIQKSSVSIFISPRKMATGDDSEDEEIMELQIPKNRITGNTFVKNPPTVRYNDTTKSYEAYEDVLPPERYVNDFFDLDTDLII